MIAHKQFGAAMNFHNQGVTRAEYQGPRGSGFTVEFLGFRALKQLEVGLELGVAVIRDTSIEAVNSSTDELKQKMRTYLDGHFRGSAMHGNNHRRVSNAAVQSATYDVHKGEPAFVSLIYSKFGFGKGPQTFVDFLLLHMRGGTVRPGPGKDWLRLPNPREPASQFGQAGFYPISGKDIFFARSKDDPGKLFQLQRTRSTGKTVLLATLLKSMRIEPTLGGLEVLMAQRSAMFESDFDAIFSRKKSEAGF